MAKLRAKKEAEVAVLAEKLRSMKSAVLSTTSGLKVKDSTELRTALRNAGVDYLVAKKTLLRRALKEASFEHIDLGRVASSFSIAFSNEDEVAAAKALAKFKRTHETLEFLGGILDGAYVDGTRIMELALLPSKDELRARLVGTIAAPLSCFLSVLSGNLRGLVRVLHGRQEQLEEVRS